MVDPLAEVVTLLQPSASHAKIASAAGRWRIRREHPGRPVYCAVLHGACRLALDGHEPITIEAADFVLIPSVTFELTPIEHQRAKRGRGTTPITELPTGEIRHGKLDAPPDVRMLVGFCTLGSTDASVLIELLPPLVHVCAEPRLVTLMQLVKDEGRAQRPARDLVLARLLEVLFIDALRGATASAVSPGLARGLADEQLAAALRGLHAHPARRWTVSQLAKEAGLSRSTFFERFRRQVGVTPMEYLLGWRMALAKKRLRTEAVSVAEVAEAVGYSSASSFSIAFSRHVGMPPKRYAQQPDPGL